MNFMIHFSVSNGRPQARALNDFIPLDILLKMNQTDQSFAASLDEVRLGLVPEGYESFPFRKEMTESFTDKLRSVVATCMFRKRIENFKAQGLDFSMYLYIPRPE
jgi:hypothetical protein